MPANQKISQLPAAAALVGTELIELVQNAPPQKNVQATASQITGLVANQFSIGGNGSSGPLIATSLANNLVYVVWSTFGVGGSSVGGGGNVQGTSGTTSQPLGIGVAPNGNATTIGNTCAQYLITSSSVANSACDMFNTAFNIGSSTIAAVRGQLNGFFLGGFTFTSYFVLPTTIPQEQLFMGLGPSNGGYGGSQTPSALLNMIGVAKDTADTGLQFMINNGSGTASKTALLTPALAPVTLASLQGHLLRVYVTCDPSGNCTAALTDMEPNGLTYTISYPAATAKLPVISSSNTSGTVNFHAHVNNGGQAVAVTLGIIYAVCTAGLGAA